MYIHKKPILLVAIMFLLVSGLVGCNSNKVTDKSIRKMLAQDEEISKLIDVSSVVIKATEDIDDKCNKFILLYGTIVDTGNNMYFPILVNTQEKQASSIYWGAPLKMIMQQVLLGEDEETNIEIFNRMAECIKLHGSDYLSSEENAIDFVNDITVNNNIIDLKTARKTIADQFINASGKSSNEFEVFFEKGTAIPKYYAVKSSERVYRWNSFVPESAYSYWSRTNRDSELLLEGMYGPAYGLETVWKVVDIQNSKELSTSYNSIEEIKKKFNVDGQETISTKTVEKSSKKQQAENTDNNDTSNKLYRVRTSYDNAQSQIGAFKVLDNAKRLADTHKAEGYKVFDENGTLVYEP